LRRRRERSAWFDARFDGVLLSSFVRVVGSIRDARVRPWPRYERAAIDEWLRAHETSPKTGLRLEHKHLVPNFAIRSAIDELKQSRAAAADHR
jgi:hypothetical protein